MENLAAAVSINGRIARLSLGNFGDHKPISDGLSELRIDTGPGYRVYFTRRGKTLVILLIDGAKGTQKRDIKRALARIAPDTFVRARRYKRAYAGFQ